MANAIATLESVGRAKAELEAAGKPVNQETVLDFLGGGSKTTIGRILKQLRAEPELPPVPVTVDLAFRQVWRSALQAADAAAEEARVELDEAHDQIEYLNAQIAAAADNAERVAAEIAVVKAEAASAIAQANAQADAAKANAAAVEQELAALRAERALLAADKERHVADITALRSENGDLHKELREVSVTMTKLATQMSEQEKTKAAK